PGDGLATAPPTSYPTEQLQRRTRLPRLPNLHRNVSSESTRPDSGREMLTRQEKISHEHQHARQDHRLHRTRSLVDAVRPPPARVIPQRVHTAALGHISRRPRSNLDCAL